MPMMKPFPIIGFNRLGIDSANIGGANEIKMPIITGKLTIIA